MHKVLWKQESWNQFANNGEKVIKESVVWYVKGPRDFKWFNKETTWFSYIEIKKNLGAWVS